MILSFIVIAAVSDARLRRCGYVCTSGDGFFGYDDGDIWVYRVLFVSGRQAVY